MHSFSITVQVNDARPLYAVALADYLADNNRCTTAHADALGILGDASAPNVNACLVQLLDPRALAGCTIQDSGAHEDAEPQSVLIVMDGGLLQSVMSDAPLRAIVVDYDIEGSDNAVHDIPQAGGGTERGLIYARDADIDPQAITELGAFAKAANEADAGPFYVMAGEKSCAECTTMEEARSRGRELADAEPLPCTFWIADTEGDHLEDIERTDRAELPELVKRFNARHA